MADPLPRQPPPASIHAMGLSVTAPLAVTEWMAEPNNSGVESEGLAEIIVPKPITITVSGDLRLLFPVGTYRVPKRTLHYNRVLQPDNTYAYVPVATNIAGDDDTTLHWYLRHHGAKHSGAVIWDQPPVFRQARENPLAPAAVVEQAAPPPPPTPPAPDPRERALAEAGAELERKDRQMAAMSALIEKQCALLEQIAAQFERLQRAVPTLRETP
jgi:hypothetical protein